MPAPKTRATRVTLSRAGTPKVWTAAAISLVFGVAAVVGFFLGSASLGVLLAAVRPKPEARFVILHGYDDYTTNLPLADFAAPDALLAHRWEGEPLPVEHGGPVRLVVPHLYFWKSAKWLRRIEFVTEDRRGFWEDRGYHDRGDPWKQQRYQGD